MVKSILASCICVLAIACSIQAQLNVELVGKYQYDHGTNDIWGWADGEGTEYALVGTVEGFSIVSLENPETPVELHFIDGSTNTWRDIKTWEHYAYVTTEANDGLLIVDLGTIANDTVSYHFYKPAFEGVGTYRKAHNLYIDERGILYLSGSNLANGGVVLLDLRNDPWMPEPFGVASNIYSHDAFAQQGLLFSSEIYNGNLSIYQVDIPFATELVGQTKTPFEFTHNAWATPDNKTVFTTDERANAWVASYDISDLTDIRELDRFKPATTAGNGVIPHNVHVLNDYLIISYYTDGCIIVDASRPDNLIEVGNYDSYLGGDGGFNGVWGAYPFLPSGTVLITDRGNGLFVLTPTYVRGCYLEGVVKDAVTLDPIFQASVTIEADEDVLAELTKFDGTFKTGKAVPGTFQVIASAPGYIPDTLDVMFENGVLVEEEIFLQPKPRHNLSGIVMSTVLSGPAPNANVYMSDGFFEYQTTCDGNGAFQVPEVVEGTYTVYAGVWGEFLIGNIDVFSSGVQTITLEPGYYDDFLYDYNWIVSGNSTEAEWERAIPQLQTLFGFFQCGPGSDVQGDFGDYAYVTGNMGQNAEANSVENGYTLLSSPGMDLRNYGNLVLSFRPWICQLVQSQPMFFVMLSNGQDTVTLDTILPTDINGSWRPATEIALDGLLELTDNMQVHFLAIDTITLEENTLKTAIDMFSVTGDYTPSSVIETGSASIAVSVFPNPFTTSVYIRFSAFDKLSTPTCVVTDLTGRVITTEVITHDRYRIDLPEAAPDGIYVIRIQDGQASTTMKIARVSGLR